MKTEIESILRTGNWRRLEAEAQVNPRVLGGLIRALYLPEEDLAWRAVEGFGRAVAALAGIEEELCRDRMRRLFWALNDESGTSGRFVAPAVGEAVARAPEVFGENALILMNVLDEPYLQAGAAWAFGRIGSVRPDLVREAVPEILPLLRSADPAVRGHAVWALGEIGAAEAVADLKALADNAGSVKIYINGQITETTVGKLAAAAAAKLEKA